MSATVSVGAFVGGVRNGKAFQVMMSGGDSHSFDSFKCARVHPSAWKEGGPFQNFVLRRF